MKLLDKITAHAMDTFCSQYEGSAQEAYLRLKGCEDWSSYPHSLDIDPWEPFEAYDVSGLIEVVDDFILAEIKFLKGLGIVCEK